MLSDCAPRPDLETAYGAMRDGLAALTNLRTILRSRRIGPRPLSKAIADMHSLSQTMRESFDVILSDLQERTNGAGCLDELAQFASTRLDELDDELTVASAAGAKAKSRLRLEAHVVRIESDLAAVRQLVEMLNEATSRCLIELDAAALVQGAIEALDPRFHERERTVELFVGSTNLGPLQGVSGNPHTLMPLIGVGLGLLADAGADRVTLTIRASENIGIMLSFSEHDELRDTSLKATSCAVPHVIPPTAGVAVLAASVAGASFRFVPESRRLVMQVSPGQQSEVILRADSVRIPSSHA